MGPPYIKQKDIKMLKIQYDMCFQDGEQQLEQEMEAYVKKEMRKYHRSSESLRDRCVIEKLCSERRYKKKYSDLKVK